MDLIQFSVGFLILVVVLSGILSESRRAARLARLEWKLDAIVKKLEIDLNADVDPEVLASAKAGRKIEAIKRYREITGAGLKEAKDFVEAVVMRKAPPNAAIFPLLAFSVSPFHPL